MPASLAPANAPPAHLGVLAWLLGFLRALIKGTGQVSNWGSVFRVQGVGAGAATGVLGSWVGAMMPACPDFTSDGISEPDK